MADDDLALAAAFSLESLLAGTHNVASGQGPRLPTLEEMAGVKRELEKFNAKITVAVLGQDLAKEAVTHVASPMRSTLSAFYFQRLAERDFARLQDWVSASDPPSFARPSTPPPRPFPSAEEQREASDPTTPSERLVELGVRFPHELGDLVYQNPNLASRVLLTWLQSGYDSVWLNPWAMSVLVEHVSAPDIEKLVAVKLGHFRARWGRWCKRGARRPFDPARDSLRAWWVRARDIMHRQEWRQCRLENRPPTHGRDPLMEARNLRERRAGLERDLRVLEALRVFVPVLPGGSGGVS